MNRHAAKKQNTVQKQKRYLLLFCVCSFLLFASLLLICLLPKTTFWSELQNPVPSNEPSDAPTVSGGDASVSQGDVSDGDSSASGNADVSGNESTPGADASSGDSSFTDRFADYDFTKPVPVSTAADISYFNDSVFIGDSRTEGFILNLNLSQIHAYTQKGLMVNTVFTEPVIELDDRMVTVMDAVRETSFSKVYIMLGINELGWGYSSKFIEKYGQIIDEIRTINPDAVIYIQSLLPVSQTVSETHNYVKNDKIKEYNILLAQLAAEKKVFFLDTAAAVIDENGCLPDDAATDGIHLKKAYCEKWLQYLQTHTISVP